MHIFYKDLNFHSALTSNASKQQVLPVFLWSEYLNQDVDTTASLLYRWQWASIFNQRLLPSSVNMPILQSIGDIVAICQTFAIDEVTMLRHFEPREIEFQEKLALELKAYGIECELFDNYRLNSKIIVDKVDYDFSLYYNLWKKQDIGNTCLNAIAWIDIDLGNRYLKLGKTIDMQSDFNAYQSILNGKPLDSSVESINLMLNNGLLNVIDVYIQVLYLPESKIKEKILYNLAFRDFAYAVLEQKPRFIDSNYKESKRLWLNGALDYQLWCKGETGNKEIDAAMKNLFENGRMSGDMRLLSADYLVNELKITWQEGALWFKEHLLDYDLAMNSLAWQYVAGTGIDLPFLDNNMRN